MEKGGGVTLQPSPLEDTQHHRFSVCLSEKAQFVQTQQEGCKRQLMTWANEKVIYYCGIRYYTVIVLVY